MQYVSMLNNRIRDLRSCSVKSSTMLRPSHPLRRCHMYVQFFVLVRLKEDASKRESCKGVPQFSTPLKKPLKALHTSSTYQYFTGVFFLRLSYHKAIHISYRIFTSYLHIYISVNDKREKFTDILQQT